MTITSDPSSYSPSCQWSRNNETTPGSSDRPPVVKVVLDPPPQPDEETKDNASNPRDDADPEQNDADTPIATRQRQNHPLPNQVVELVHVVDESADHRSDILITICRGQSEQTISLHPEDLGEVENNLLTGWAIKTCSSIQVHRLRLYWPHRLTQ